MTVIYLNLPEFALNIHPKLTASMQKSIGIMDDLPNVKFRVDLHDDLFFTFPPLEQT